MKTKKKQINRIFILFIVLCQLFYTNILYSYNTGIYKEEDLIHDSNDNIIKISNQNNNHSNLIIFFNSSSFNTKIIENFISYGGIIDNNKIWNDTFDSVSGFAGVLPNENISLFQSNWDNINIEKNEIIETQMNYVSLQSGAINSSNYLGSFKGDTNSSIAILDSGIDSNHEFFPNGYNPLNLDGDIVGWEDFINNSLMPSDDNGHGTFISSVITGTGNEPYDSSNPTIVNIYGNYSHTKLFDDSGEPGNFTLKIFSFNTTRKESNIFINSSWNYHAPGIDNCWIELYFNKTELVSYNNTINPNEWYTINYSSSKNGQAVYDLYLKYHKQDNTFPEFSFNTSISYFPEFYVKDYAYFTGIANSSKLVSYKIINQTGIGYASDLISALASVIHNRSKYHIISVCLSIGSSSSAFIACNRIIDEVVENGVLVVIAVGNYGPYNSGCVNGLASNKKAIVVGAINDKDQVTSYSSRGKDLGEGVVKPDLLAPGGSLLPGHRLIVGADSKSKEMTAAYGTSIAAAIVAAAVNILIDAKWGNWNQWEQLNFTVRNDIIKSTLLMTCSETNLEREDDPSTDDVDESIFSPNNFIGISSTLKDHHEGYGRLNIQAAIDALTKYIKINETLKDYLISSEEDPLGDHVSARRVNFIANTQYLINLTEVEESADLDVFLFSNQSSRYGEPILLGSSQGIIGDPDYFYFIPKKNQTECIVIVKAIAGNSTFKLNITNIENRFPPELSIPEVESRTGGISKNTTIMSYEEFEFGEASYGNYTTGKYYFFINYTDVDELNIPPQEVYVSIEGRNYSMSPRYLFNNYTQGALFMSNPIKFSIPGTFHYFFVASDGKETRYPKQGKLNITIEYPTEIEAIPYNHSFNDGLDNWYYTGTGWGLLNQSNINDDRSGNYLEDTWKSMYFGYYLNHNYPLNYSYQPLYYGEDSPNGTLYSPVFNLSGLNQDFHPFAKFGIRISINALDFMYLQINVNWTGWESLKSYTNMEDEWFLEEINMSDYIESLIQFRFVSSVDGVYDSIKNKGFMLDYFAIESYINYQAPVINFDLTSNLSPQFGSKYQQFSFSCNYTDPDNNYPQFVYIEIENENYSMINKYGDWNANTGNGIIFSTALILEGISNLSFRFHVSDGEYINSTDWYNQDNSEIVLSNPTILQFNVIKSGHYIGYDFSNINFDDYFITGTPIPGEITAWLTGDNTWHSLFHPGIQQDILYGGIGQRIGLRVGQGYEKKWNAKLITRPLRLGDDYPLYLQFTQNISLQNEVFYNKTDYDECRISISTDYGQSWKTLQKYRYDSEDLAGNVEIDLSKYENDVVMIMFNIYSNDYEPSVIVPNAIGDGWFLYNIYMGYHKSTDLIPPIIEMRNIKINQIIHSVYEMEISITDDVGIDISRLTLFINDKSISSDDFDYDKESGILKYKWDTLQYEDGEYEIKVIAFDKEGNRVEKSKNVYVNNSLLYWLQLTISGSNEPKPEIWNIIVPILLLLIILASIGWLVIVRKRKRNRWMQISRKTVISERKTDVLNKDQIIKRISRLNIEDELKRPITLHCKFCNSWFYQESPEFDIICPLCSNDQIYVAYNCIYCGKWTFKDETKESYYCSKCASFEKVKAANNKKFNRFHKKEKILIKKESVRLIRREKDDIEEILEKEGKILRRFESKKKNKLDILNL
ncbi:MAG: S8 family serine peptidase [Promethearchaeota archaeon]